MSLYVVENASKDPGDTLAIFKYFVVQFREIISNKSCGYLEVALAVTGYGYFAAVRAVMLSLPLHTQYVHSFSVFLHLYE